MKHLATKNAYPDARHAWLMAVTAAFVIGVLRTALTPYATEHPLAYGLVLGFTLVVLAGFLLFCRLTPTPATTVIGTPATAAAIAAAVTGAAFVVFAFVSAVNWVVFNVTPYPSKVLLGTPDKVFLLLLIASATAAGIFFLMLAIRWFRTRTTHRYVLSLAAVLPTVWVWFRLIRYVTSYASLVGLFHDLYDVVMILFEAVFFYLFARYLAGEEQTTSRFFVGVSLCTGVLCAVGCFTQVALYILQDKTSFETCALIVAPDFGVAALSFTMAFAQLFGDTCDDSPEIVPVMEPETEPEDGDGAEFLISDAWFTVLDPEETNDEDET